MAKAKKTTPTKPQHDYIILDRSGSMAGRWDDTLGGVNAYVHTLAKDNATKEIFLTVAVFDTVNAFEMLRKDVQALHWTDITNNEASPRAGTPLFDAIGRLVTVAEKDAPDKCAIVIVTDGHENASKEHTRESIKGLLDSCRKKGWQVIFLGADFDNVTQAADLGNAAGQTMTMDSRNSVYAMSATASTRGAYGLSGQNMNFSQDVREQAAGPGTIIPPKAQPHDPSKSPSPPSGKAQ